MALIKYVTKGGREQRSYGPKSRQEKISINGNSNRKSHFRKQWVGKRRKKEQPEILKEDIKEMPRELKKQVIADIDEVL